MKYRKLTAILGTFGIIAAMTGCQKASTDIELETLEISSIEVVEETEDESDQMETLELDFSEIDETAGDSLVVSTGDLVEPEGLYEVTEAESETTESIETANSRKPGEAEGETELTEELTESVKNESSRNEKPIKESAEEDTGTKQSETVQTEKVVRETELFSVQTEKVQQLGETVPETEKENNSENEKATEEVTESESEKATEEVTESESEKATEEVTESESEKAAEEVTESESEKTTEVLTESESEEVTEEVTEPDSGETAEEAVASEAEEISGIMTVSDRVNVRKEPSTEAEIAALFTPGMKLLVIDREGDWAAVRFETGYGLTDGYIKTEFLCDAEYVYYAKEDVNVRAEASIEAEKTGALLANERVLLMEYDEDGWSKVRYATETGLMEAFVKSEFLEKAELSKGAAALMPELEALNAAQAEQETAAEVENEAEVETETEMETETETETETEMETETEAGSDTAVVLPEGIAGQYELTKLLLPEASSVGIIYSSEDEDAAGQVTEYKALAEEYGFEIQLTVIEDALDIDLAASSMVGTVDCIFCIDDEVVNELVQTICAYADEVEIPVIGITEAHSSMGCIASYDGETVIWNADEAELLDLNLDALNLKNIKLYQ